MTLEDALGRPIETIEDAVLARAMFAYVKHDWVPYGYADVGTAAQADIDGMSNTQFLVALAMGFEDLKGATP